MGVLLDAGDEIFRGLARANNGIVMEDDFYRVCEDKLGISRKLSKAILRNMEAHQMVSKVVGTRWVVRTWVTS